MTINQIIDAINARATASGNAPSFGTDFAGVYGISMDEARRIAERSETLEQFEDIWQNESDWRDQ